MVTIKRQCKLIDINRWMGQFLFPQIFRTCNRVFFYFNLVKLFQAHKFGSIYILQYFWNICESKQDVERKLETELFQYFSSFCSFSQKLNQNFVCVCVSVSVTFSLFSCRLKIIWFFYGWCAKHRNTRDDVMVRAHEGIFILYLMCSKNTENMPNLPGHFI